ncbi:hypothetical protein JOC95_003451 [Bacillus tianshenii]|uniref:Uncharacterized protein n=1 Tax=Sutcliffiella tianshenii TaxID=1463404 RepID=A0ABS2P3L4_9BACI|nr:hypothetical protein [Bacillus tianshenii]
MAVFIDVLVVIVFAVIFFGVYKYVKNTLKKY